MAENTETPSRFPGQIFPTLGSLYDLGSPDHPWRDLYLSGALIGAGAVSTGVFNVKAAPFNAIGNGVADDTVAIQAANAVATVAGGTVYLPPATYRIAGTLTFTTHVDGTGATLLVDGGGVRLGTTGATPISRLVAYLPKIVSSATGTPPSTWGGANIGLWIVGLLESEVHIPYVLGFDTGVKLGDGGTGTSYLTVTLGRIYNCKKGLYFTNGTAWANQNTVLGGIVTYDSAVGTAVSGVRAILMDDTGAATNPNGNTIIGTSIEGDVPEFHAEVYGPRNQLINVRWESSVPKVQFNSAGATGNLIEGGDGMGTLVLTQINSASRNRFEGGARTIRAMGASPEFEAVQNANGDSDPIRRIYPLAANLSTPDATWIVQETGQQIDYKSTADAQPRMRISLAGVGRLMFGNGTVTSASWPYLEYLSANLMRTVGGLKIAAGQLVESDVTLTYGASIATNAALGNWFIVTVTDGVAHVFANPTNATQGQKITLTIRNTFGVIATATFSAIWKTAGYAAPANGFSASAQFQFNGTNWVQTTLWTSAIPN